MRNAFGGECYRCGLFVPPGAGYFEKKRGQRGWRVQHCYRTHNGGITCEMALNAAGRHEEAAAARLDPPEVVWR